MPLFRLKMIGCTSIFINLVQGQAPIVSFVPSPSHVFLTMAVSRDDKACLHHAHVYSKTQLDMVFPSQTPIYTQAHLTDCLETGTTIGRDFRLKGVYSPSSMVESVRALTLNFSIKSPVKSTSSCSMVSRTKLSSGSAPGISCTTSKRRSS